MDKPTAPYTLFQSSHIVGAWRIGGVQGFHIMLTKRPRWLTRVLCKLLLEWDWKDAT